MLNYCRLVIFVSESACRMKKYCSINLSCLILTGFLLVGCGNSAKTTSVVSGSSAAVVSSATTEGGTIKGRVATVLAQLSGSKTGGSATTTSNGVVYALDQDGQLLGMGVIGADGQFLIDNVTPGPVTLLAYTDPNAAAPSSQATVSVYAQAVTQLNPSVAIDRAQAVAKVKEQASDSALILGSLSPLPAGTVVKAASGNGAEHTAGADEWFFMVDPNPNFYFDHDVDYVFVNAQTGSVETVAADFFPEINGIPQWSGDREYLDWGEFDIDQPLPESLQATPREEVVQLGSLNAQGDVAALNASAVLGQLNTTADSVFFVGLVGSDEFPFDLSLKRMVDFFLSAGVPRANMRLVLAGSRAKAAANDALVDAIDGANSAIALRAEKGLSSTLIFYAACHGSKSNIYITTPKELGEGAIRIKASDLVSANKLGLVERSKACRVRLLIESCRSGGFIGLVHDTFVQSPGRFPQNVISYSAANATRPTGGNSKGAEIGGNFSIAAVKQMRLEDGDINGLASLDTVPPRVLSPLADIEVFDLSRNEIRRSEPQVLVWAGKPDFCSSSKEEIPSPKEAPASEQSLLFFVNNTGSEASLTLEWEGGSKNLTLPAGGSVRQEFAGPAKVQVSQFKTAPTTINRLEGVVEIPSGTLRTLEWKSTSLGGFQLLTALERL